MSVAKDGQRAKISRTEISKDDFPQDGFCATFFDLKIKSCSKCGMAREETKNTVKCSEQLNFCANLCIAEIFRKHSVRVFPQWERQISPKNGLQKINIKTQHCTMIQSRMPTRWSCKPNQFPYASSEKDLEERIVLPHAALNHSSHQETRSKNQDRNPVQAPCETCCLAIETMLARPSVKIFELG